jgi:hypothetical protein
MFGARLQASTARHTSQANAFIHYNLPVDPALKEILMNYTRLLLTPLFLAAMLFGCSAIASAQTPLVYVSALGLDSNSGGRTSPVQTINRALSLVQTGGEIVVIDSGDYKEFSVTKSVTIETAPGVIAVIPDLDSGACVTVSVGSSATVALKGLTMTAPTGSGYYGIKCTGGTLLVDNCTVNGAFNYGIYADCASLMVKDTGVMGCNSYGIFAVSSSSAPLIATIERCRLEDNGWGLTAYYNSKVTVRDTVASGNRARGMQAQGFNGYTSELNVERCVASGNVSGIVTDNSSGGTVIARVSDTIATDNSYGFYVYGGTTFYTRGNNTIAGSTTADVGGGSLTPLNAY